MKMMAFSHFDLQKWQFHMVQHIWDGADPLGMTSPVGSASLHPSQLALFFPATTSLSPRPQADPPLHPSGSVILNGINFFCL